MALCPGITQASEFSCATQTPAGTGIRAYIYDWEDFQSATITEGALPDDTITAITNASGKAGFLVTVPSESNILATSTSRVVDNGVDGFDHSVKLNFYDTSQTSKNNIAAIRFRRIVIFVEKLDGTYQLYGRGIGLKLNPASSNISDPTVGNHIECTFTTPTTTGPELKMEQTVDAGTKATTQAVMDGIIVPGV